MAGYAKEATSEFEGTYILNDNLINGNPHWMKTDGSQAIWFSKKYSTWSVGLKSYLGEDDGWIFGPEDGQGKDSYPNEIKQGWQYWYDDDWYNAGSNDVVFKAIFNDTDDVLVKQGLFFCFCKCFKFQPYTLKIVNLAQKTIT